MNAVTEVMDELRKALSEVDDIRASLRRKVRHCDELTEERDQMERERDEARAALAKCPDCAMWAERSTRWHDDMQRAERERDEARAEVEHAYREGGALYEAKIAEREAFRCGAEAMREACLGVAERFMDFGSPHPGMIAHKISALPIPEEP